VAKKKKAPASGNSGNFGGPSSIEPPKRSRAEVIKAQRAAAKAKRQANDNVGKVKVNDANSVLESQFDTAKKTTQAGNQLNNANQVNEYGQQTITYDENGNPTVTQELNEQEKTKLDQERGLEIGANEQAQESFGQLQDQWGQPLNYDSQPEVNVDQEAFRKDWESKVYGRQAQELDKQFQKQGQSFEQTMADRGIPVGSELYNAQQAEFEKNKAGAYEDARISSMQQSGQEAQRQFGNNLTARQQGIGEQNYLRDRPLNEMGGLMALGSGVAQPQYQGFQGQAVAGTDVAGTALGYASLAQGGADSAAQRQLQQQALNKARGGGGGTSQADRDASYEDWKRRQDYMLQNQPRQPKQPGAGQRIAEGLGSGIAGGIGQGIANSIPKLF
jgi:hypothetical protein